MSRPSAITKLRYLSNFLVYMAPFSGQERIQLKDKYLLELYTKNLENENKEEEIKEVIQLIEKVDSYSLQDITSLLFLIDQFKKDENHSASLDEALQLPTIPNLKQMIAAAEKFDKDYQNKGSVEKLFNAGFKTCGAAAGILVLGLLAIVATPVALLVDFVFNTEITLFYFLRLGACFEAFHVNSNRVEFNYNAINYNKAAENATILCGFFSQKVNQDLPVVQHTESLPLKVA